MKNHSNQGNIREKLLRREMLEDFRFHRLIAVIDQLKRSDRERICTIMFAENVHFSCSMCVFYQRNSSTTFDRRIFFTFQIDKSILTERQENKQIEKLKRRFSFVLLSNTRKASHRRKTLTKLFHFVDLLVFSSVIAVVLFGFSANFHFLNDQINEIRYFLHLTLNFFLSEEKNFSFVAFSTKIFFVLLPSPLFLKFGEHSIFSRRFFGQLDRFVIFQRLSDPLRKRKFELKKLICRTTTKR